jgi:hypothetical protein
MTMREFKYQVSFNALAFLGSAEQQAEWHTPPIKALLRRWWRVVKAPEAHSTATKVGVCEPFGHANSALNSHTGVFA